MPHRTTAVFAPFALALSLCAGLTGCQSGRIASSSAALASYERGDYEGAYKEAIESHRRTSGVAQERAALVAGMSAFELGRYNDAVNWLNRVDRSQDSEIAGKATATLGLVHVERGNYSLAAIDLTNAGRLLRGEEAARAYFFAGECYTLVGRLDAAQRSYALARAAGASTTGISGQARDRLAPSDFTVQVGAFSQWSNAESAARTARARASAVGLDAPRIVQSQDVNGRTLYLVQVGSYKSKQEALSARVRLGGEAVVVPLRDS